MAPVGRGIQAADARCQVGQPHTLQGCQELGVRGGWERVGDVAGGAQGTGVSTGEEQLWVLVG